MEKKKNYGTLQTKLIGFVLSAVFATFVLVSFGVLFITFQNNRDQEIENQRHQLEKASSHIRMVQESTMNLVKQVMLDEIVYEAAGQEEQSTGNYLYAKRMAQSKLTDYSHIMDEIQEIMIYTEDGRTFSSRYVKDPFQPEENSWFEEFVVSGKKSGFSQIHQSEANQDGHTQMVVSYMTRYYPPEYQRGEIGWLVVNMELDVIEEMARLETMLLEGYCLLDDSGNEIVTDGEINLAEDALQRIENGETMWEEASNVFLANTELEDGWILISEISGAELLGRSVQVAAYQGLIFLIAMVVLFVILRLLISRITRPIHQLGEAARKVGKGDFSIRVDIHTKDELELLAHAFNKMVVNIQSLMHESVEHEKQVRRMQIENLLLQINPHFIYNTLNSIVYMARMEGNRQIADFTGAFIALLQSTLNIRESVFSTVRDELRCVENYLNLQKYRYEDKFTYEIQCEEELLECQMLNVMLQPIVENAIFHGIAPMEGNGALKIRIIREEDALRISVEDNGVGMTRESIEEQFKKDYRQEGGVRKLGVSNVRERIREIYGEPYDMVIESQPGKGTWVIMRIPFRLEKER